MKVKSVSELAFKTLESLTEGEDELWVAHAVFNREAARTGEVQKIMKEDCGISYYAVQNHLKSLVAKGIIIREYQGKYIPNLKMLLPKMIEILEAEEAEGQEVGETGSP